MSTEQELARKIAEWIDINQRTGNGAVRSVRLLEQAADTISKLREENKRLREALTPLAREPLTVEAEYRRTRLFSWDDYDAKILAARSALSSEGGEG